MVNDEESCVRTRPVVWPRSRMVDLLGRPEMRRSGLSGAEQSTRGARSKMQLS